MIDTQLAFALEDSAMLSCSRRKFRGLATATHLTDAISPGVRM